MVDGQISLPGPIELSFSPSLSLSLNLPLSPFALDLYESFTSRPLATAAKLAPSFASWPTDYQLTTKQY